MKFRCPTCKLRHDNCVCAEMGLRDLGIARPRISLSAKPELKQVGVTYPRLYVNRCKVCEAYPCGCRSKIWC